MIVLRSTTGMPGIGSSIIANSRAAKRYQPSKSATKKQAPVATDIVPAYAVLPSAVNHKVAEAKLNPIVAMTKTPTKMMFVRREQIRKMKDSMARERG